MSNFLVIQKTMQSCIYKCDIYSMPEKFMKEWID